MTRQLDGLSRLVARQVVSQCFQMLGKGISGLIRIVHIERLALRVDQRSDSTNQFFEDTDSIGNGDGVGYLLQVPKLRETICMTDQTLNRFVD